MDLNEYSKIKDFTYENYCQYLKDKYNNKLKSNLFKHHTYENMQANLSNDTIRKHFIELNPEFKDLLVPLCYYRNGVCTEFYPCGFNKTYKKEQQ